MVRQDSSIQILLSILGVISLILVTVGVSFAFFSYEKEIQIENYGNKGKISLIYAKNQFSEQGIRMDSLNPVDDLSMKTSNESKYIFDFRIVGTSSANSEIPYEITLRKNKNSLLDENLVKVYLTELDGEKEVDTLFTTSMNEPKTFQVLTQTGVISANDEIEKTIYKGVIPPNQKDYVKKFRLRIWASSDALPLMDSLLLERKENQPFFDVKLNVYSEAMTIAQEETVEATGITFGELAPMVVGGTQVVQATFTPVTTTDKTLTWTSSNPEIISVAIQEDGSAVLTANSLGNAVIQAISQNGVCQNVTVSVVDPNQPK